ncbi:MAG: hypothetical protein HYV33_02175 [Candidatus Kerfeldbacteria bacterium]|nr:hypothetical protein [Candidatus Kerfeldbacteria bacterium]
MSRYFRLFIISAGAILVILLGVIGYQRWQANTQPKQTSEQTAQLQQLADVLASEYQKIIFLTDDGTQYVGDLALRKTAALTAPASATMSNVISSPTSWFGMTDTTLVHYTFTGSTTVGSVTHPSTADGLALDTTGQWLAWVTGSSGKQQIILYNVNDHTETVLFGADGGGSFSNLTWAPDSSALAFTTATNTVHFITPQGVEPYTPIGFTDLEINYLHWLADDQLAGVITPNEQSSSSFAPYLGVFDRSGTMIEQHRVFEKIGIPKVIWAPDAKTFALYNPWKNYFVVYNRYDQIQQLLRLTLPGKITALGWVNGNVAPATTFGTTTNSTTTNINSIAPDTTPGLFTVTADDWEQYNDTVRNVLNQFKIDFSSYRFSTTNQGIVITAELQPEANQPELIFIQVLTQTFALLPDIPTISLTWRYNTNHIITVEQLSRVQVETLAQQFTNHSIVELFVITKKFPLGKKTPKPANPNHTYLADTVYSNFGEYIPLPALGFIKALIDEDTIHYSSNYTLRYPNSWSIKNRGEGNIVFYTADTEFVSESSWTGFSVTVRRYPVPDITLDQWLFVNRSDRTVENVTIPLAAPLQAKHIVAEQTFADEYIMMANHTVYVLNIERPGGLTTIDQEQFTRLVSSFIDGSAYVRSY